MPTQQDHAITRPAVVLDESSPEPMSAIVRAVQALRIIEVANVNPANLAAGAEADLAVALPAGTIPAADVAYSIVVPIPPSTLNAGLYVRKARVSAADEITLTIRNETAGAIDAAAATWTFFLVVDLPRVVVSR